MALCLRVVAGIAPPAIPLTVTRPAPSPPVRSAIGLSGRSMSLRLRVFLRLCTPLGLRTVRGQRIFRPRPGGGRFRGALLGLAALVWAGGRRPAPFLFLFQLPLDIGRLHSRCPLEGCQLAGGRYGAARRVAAVLRIPATLTSDDLSARGLLRNLFRRTMRPGMLLHPRRIDMQIAVTPAMGTGLPSVRTGPMRGPLNAMRVQILARYP